MKIPITILFFLSAIFCGYTQKSKNHSDSEVDLLDFGEDSLYNEQLKLKVQIVFSKFMFRVSTLSRLQ